MAGTPSAVVLFILPSSTMRIFVALKFLSFAIPVLILAIHLINTMNMAFIYMNFAVNSRSLVVVSPPTVQDSVQSLDLLVACAGHSIGQNDPRPPF